jgi:SAM-dependent methyltransferase
MGARREGSFFDRGAWAYDLVLALPTVLIRRIFRLHLPALGLPTGARILDIGCGTGSLALSLAGDGFSVVGVDVSPTMIARARAKAAGDPAGDRVQFSVGDGRAPLAREEAAFDLVTLVAVLHGPASEGRLALLREARRLSRGLVLIHDYPPFPGPRGIASPLLRLGERVEGSDFGSFLRQGREEMARVFESVTVWEVARDSSWYVCRTGAAG